MAELTHAQLVLRATTWLRASRRCTIVLAECGSWFTQEIPDAIGWTSRGDSVLVECKTSRSDFYADRSKPSRRKAEPMGTVRFYMAPRGVIPVEALPENWGLIEVFPSRNGRLSVYVAQPAAEPQRVYGKLASRQQKEIALLVAEMRRTVLGVRGELSRPRRVGLQLAGGKRVGDAP